MNGRGLLLFSALFLSQSLHAQAKVLQNEFPISRLKGLYTYQEKFEVPSVRRAETVESETEIGKKRIKELRKQGYMCIRQNVQTRLCSKIWKPEQIPDGLGASIKEFMIGVEAEFEGSLNEPILIHDGSTSQEWEVRENIRLIQNTVSMYRVVRNNEGKVFLSFPISENQGIGVLNYHSNEQLSFQIIGTVKDTANSTVGYTILAYLQ